MRKQVPSGLYPIFKEARERGGSVHYKHDKLINVTLCKGKGKRPVFIKLFAQVRQTPFST